MIISTWLEEFLPLWPGSGWKTVLATNHPEFISPDQQEQLIHLLEQSAHIPGFADASPECLPVLFKSGDPVLAFRQLLDFTEAFQKERSRPFDFSHVHARELISLFGRSEYLSRKLIRDPKLAEETLHSSFLARKKPPEKMFSELEDRVGPLEPFSLDSFKNELRRWKYREFIRIAVRDLCRPEAFEETLEEWSSAAGVLLQTGLREITRKHLGLAHLHDGVLPFMVLGMGKLGGNELNHSSDVDLIFIHDDEPLCGETERDHILRLKAARILIEVLCEHTGEGFLSRVDMRLRPGGDRAPLVQSLDEVELYYSAKGELWERQALIKARPIAGTVQTAANFLKMITPFVYSRILDEGLSREIRRMKERIEEEHLRENHLNVKLGVGGIREIEFFVQTFQLLYGGAHPELREQNSLRALQLIQSRGFIPESDAQILREAYIFLRRVEHRLQMREEQQVHTIPSGAEEQRIIARGMGFEESDPEQARQKFLGKLKDVMGGVRVIFGSLFSKKHLEIEASLKNSSRIRNFTEAENAFLQKLALNLSPYLNSRTDKRFQRLFERVGAKFNLYHPLVERPSALSRLARISETSEMLWNHLLNHLDLLERLEDSVINISGEDWESRLQEMLNGAEGDEEQEIDLLRQFKNTFTLLLGSAELEGLLNYEPTRMGLTRLAEVILQEAFRMAVRRLAPAYGKAVERLGSPLQFAIVGLGKLGGRELTYHSDLHLLIVHSGSPDASHADRILIQEYGVKLIQRMISLLTTMTRTGFAYKMDTRLRPSGNAGVLVTPWKVYLRYHQTSRPWEHQALIKGRVVGGDAQEHWHTEVESGLRNTVYSWDPPEDLSEQINHLRLRKEKELSGDSDSRRNLKEGHGGLLDIEFLTQFLQLKHGREVEKLQIPETLKALEQLGDCGVLNLEQVATLREGYMFLRLIENGLRLLYDDSTNLLDYDSIEQETILMLLKRHGFEVEDLKNTVNRVTGDIREVYNTVMQCC